MIARSLSASIAPLGLAMHYVIIAEEVGIYKRKKNKILKLAFFLGRDLVFLLFSLDQVLVFFLFS